MGIMKNPTFIPDSCITGITQQLHPPTVGKQVSESMITIGLVISLEELEVEEVIEAALIMLVGTRLVELAMVAANLTWELVAAVELSITPKVANQLLQPAVVGIRELVATLAILVITMLLLATTVATPLALWVKVDTDQLATQ